jgi:hypothetical protein
MTKIPFIDGASRKPYPPKEPCPCGSGRRYKSCCYAKGFHYLIQEGGEVVQGRKPPSRIVREIPLDEQSLELLREQRRRFVEKFGREPGPDDPIFFDAPPEAEMKQATVDAMKKAGIRPALIYAYEKTGLILSETNRHLMPTADVEAFEAAVEEYDHLHGEDQGT